MKDNESTGLKKLLKLTDFDIKQDEICWNKVKMSSSRWITCCHRKTVSGVYYSSPSASSTSSSSYRHPNTTTTTDQLDPKHLQHHPQHRPQHSHHQHSHQQPRQSSPPLQPQSLFSTPKSNGRIFPGLPVPFKKKHHHYHLSDELQAVKLTNCSPFTPSTSSPSESSMFELARKSSSLSSSSSNTTGSSCSNTTANNTALHGFTPESSSGSSSLHKTTPTIMKHSASTFDLCSPSLQNNHHHHQQFAQPYSSPYHNRFHHAQPGSRPQDDYFGLSQAQSMPASEENTITIINPLDGFLINCQTNFDTTCAQISPGLDVIAVANDYWLAFYSIRTNGCYGTLQFPAKCLFWCWIGAETIALITETDVFHWTLTAIEPNSNYIRTRDPPRLQFSLDQEIRDNQITDYSIDVTCGAWCAVSSLFLDDDGDIGGKIQIFSRAHQKSQCIEAHSCKFTSYLFEDSPQKSTLLLAAKRENDFHWKLHIVELGPIPEGNHNHRSKTQQLMLHPKRLQAIGLNSKDIPTNIICDESIGLVYLMSKYGSFYICDIETGLPLYYDLLDIEITEGQALFAFSFDPDSDTLVAVSRTGLVISIRVDVDHLIANSQTCVAQPKIAKRIRLRRQQQLQEQHQQESSVHISKSRKNGTVKNNGHQSKSHNDQADNGTAAKRLNGQVEKAKNSSVNINYSFNQKHNNNSHHHNNLPKHYQHSQSKPMSTGDHRHYLQYLHNNNNNQNNILKAEWNNNNIDIENFRLKARACPKINGNLKQETEEESESSQSVEEEEESYDESEYEHEDELEVSRNGSGLLPRNLHLKHRDHHRQCHNPNANTNRKVHHHSNNNNNSNNGHNNSHHHHHRHRSLKPVVHHEEDEEIVTRL